MRIGRRRDQLLYSLLSLWNWRLLQLLLPIAVVKQKHVGYRAHYLLDKYTVRKFYFANDPEANEVCDRKALHGIREPFQGVGCCFQFYPAVRKCVAGGQQFLGHWIVGCHPFRSTHYLSVSM